MNRDIRVAMTWAFAPIQTAVIVGCGAVILRMIATMSYFFVLRGRERREPTKG